MDRNNVTKKIVAAKVAGNMTWDDTAAKIGKSMEWTTAALLGQMPLGAKHAAVARDAVQPPAEPATLRLC